MREVKFVNWVQKLENPQSWESVEGKDRKEAKVHTLQNITQPCSAEMEGIMKYAAKGKEKTMHTLEYAFVMSYNALRDR